LNACLKYHADARLSRAGGNLLIEYSLIVLQTMLQFKKQIANQVGNGGKWFFYQTFKTYKE
jgi:hypothetical protein